MKKKKLISINSKAILKFSHVLTFELITDHRPFEVLTINKFIKANHYPFPIINEILSEFHGCGYFCVLDLNGAYQQLEVSELTQ